ncbi:MAG: hypothetical protein GWN12_21160 [Thermoplasmata archaeon]|nr:hypothetical protein [Thermoplasmata archaeon]NIS14517.1 hypothetical protein [Thermoplasmata archaeon]NIS22353.1 hypothetical protein [Thermoplasmata archaeon]NIW91216.1 hypothetical protein [Thermoplasmata archaeon]
MELKTAVDGRGYFLERGGIPLHGSVQEDPPTFELRNRLFRDAMAPRILERLTREFGME